ncbi:MAG: acetyl-CoA carboxylase, biotin carboxyl carrier protein [Rhodobacteraceae bacterium]|nr:acetyl-CoA carboxylase, biotin carboxyl carrier protein [Paracoccaceae bacterium]
MAFQLKKDIELVESLSKILSEHNLEEISFSRRTGTNEQISVRVSAHRSARVEVAPRESVTHRTEEIPDPGGEVPDAFPENHPGLITAPMVGTIYLSPEPDARPFVEVGQQINEGDTVVIIEAMKTMNHIPATRPGVVRRILVENASAVEYGAPLVIIE